jgi:hypothetical protein
MPIETTHIDYINHIAQWELCRDLSAGEDAVKLRGERYVPKLSGQNATEYAAYLNRASLYGAFGRTVDGLVGMIGRKKPERSRLQGAIASLTDDIDNAGTSLDRFAFRAARDAIEIGRYGILVEYPNIPEGTTIGEAERNQLRPYAAYYPAESIVDWHTQNIGSAQKLIMVKLKEYVSAPLESDPWTWVSDYRFRVLWLLDGVYRQEVYDKSGTLLSSTIPMIAGQTLGRIPFSFGGGINATKPPMLDLANLNISHFRNSADYENGLHWIGTPTPIFSGNFANTNLDADGNIEIRLGATSGIQMTEGGDAHFLEFNGQGLEGNLGRALDRKANQMAVLGAKMLETEKRTAESYDTVAIRRQEETSILASIANDVSRTIQEMLGYMDWYYGGNSSVEYWLNTDFLPQPVDGNMVREMVAAWQSGAFSTPELFEFMKQGEVIDSGKTLAEHEQEVMDDSVRVGLMAKAALLEAKAKTAAQPAQAATT